MVGFSKRTADRARAAACSRNVVVHTARQSTAGGRRAGARRPSGRILLDALQQNVEALAGTNGRPCDNKERSIHMLSLFRVGLRSSVALFLVVGVACGTAPSGDAASTAKTLSELRTADSTVSAAIAARDAERTATFYADDAVLMPVAEPIVEGRVRHFGRVAACVRDSRLCQHLAAGGIRSICSWRPRIHAWNVRVTDAGDWREAGCRAREVGFRVEAGDRRQVAHRPRHLQHGCAAA